MGGKVAKKVEDGGHRDEISDDASSETLPQRYVNSQRLCGID